MSIPAATKNSVELETDNQEKWDFWRRAIDAKPPRVRFATEIRDALVGREHIFDHIEFMMFSLEHHPLIPFEKYTFGSDLLDFRRAVAYEIVLRLLAHARSFVANVNIRNRPGAGTALRCMLDMFALMKYLAADNRLQDRNLLEKFLCGQSFATGAYYFLNKEWLSETGATMPLDTRKLLETWLGLPRTGLITNVAHSSDEGFSALYARYSEYVHFVFAQPRMEIEEAFGHTEEMTFGSEEYFRGGQTEGAPIEVLSVDLDTASFIFQMSWPLLFPIDPFLAEDTRAMVKEKLTQQGLS